jgi:hypothetical protein
MPENPRWGDAALQQQNVDGFRRKALTGITAKMARVVHAIIKSGSDYPPFVEGRVPGGRISFCGAVRAPKG